MIYSTKRLGLTITSTLSWNEHVNNISKQATKKLWVPFRFKELGVATDQLFKVDQTRVQTTFEYAAPVSYGD